MEIEIISRENIKPSSPTPQNLRNYKFSLIDQIAPTFRFPIILYFPPNPNNKNNTENFISESTKTLKQSLSKLLTRFYPFAGTIKDHLSIDCNDQGFLFVVAKTKSNLSNYLEKNDQKSNLDLLPCQIGWSDPGPGVHVAMAQVNYFDCGGIAIGFVFSHRAADGVTMCSFIKSWSLLHASLDGCTQVVCPNYIIQNFFPQNEGMRMDSDVNSCLMRFLKIGKTKMRRYVFDSRAIKTLKAKTGDQFDRLSRVEVVTAFLWKCFIFACKSKLTLLTQAVNLRKRTHPLLPDECFGNFLWLAGDTCETGESVEMENLVGKLRGSISKFDDDFITRMHGDDGLSGYYKNVGETWGKYPECAEFLAVSSWCNFGVDKIDFGWGNPIWVNNLCGSNELVSPYINTVWLIDTKKGDGVEAWVTLDQEYIKLFDDIKELNVLASVDPNPFDI